MERTGHIGNNLGPNGSVELFQRSRIEIEVNAIKLASQTSSRAAGMPLLVQV
jgi:hypothetical protein